MTMVPETTVVMHLYYRDGLTAVFNDRDPNDLNAKARRALTLTTEAHEELGLVDELTITIRCGDLLNP